MLLMTAPRYVARLVDPLLDRMLSGLPAVLVVGPRASGKTTTARRHVADLVRLDQPADAATTRADPDLALRLRDEPLLLDEWQLVPEVLGALKRAVDDDPRPGRFVVTGSSQADLGAAGWPATGRTVRVPMWGLCQRELYGDVTAPPLLDRIVEDGLHTLRVPAHPPDLAGYVEAALRGGFPEAALQEDADLRRRWFASYVEEIVVRDGALVDGGRDPVRLRRYLQSLAANTAGVVQHKTLYDAAGINRMTAIGYDRLLEVLLVVESLPAWSTHRLSRLTSTPKRHLVEPALLGPLLGVEARAVLRDPDVLGRLLDSFVTAQLRAELVVSSLGPKLYHLRQADGRREVDLIVELTDGRLVAIEVKAAAAPDSSDARHLIWLRDQLGSRMVAALVLHGGPYVYPLAERVYAAPICSLWTA
jgi:predicted AAA+ superfamily ATPase